MSSTVTTTTISSIASVPFVAPLVLITVLLYLGLLVCKDLSTNIANTSARGRFLHQVLDVAVVPLMMVFAVAVVSRIVLYLA